MAIKIETIRRNLVLKEIEAKETPDGKPIYFAIKFVKKDGELVFVPRAEPAGLKVDQWKNRMRGIQPVDALGNPSGHVTPVHIDSIVEFNGKKVRM